MDKQINNTIRKIIHIPQDFHDRKNVSEINLLAESNYIEFYDQINEDDISKVLKQYSNLIDEWLQWSADKRSTPTWHFVKYADNKYSVEYSSAGKESEEINTTDKFIACAIFIKREIEIGRILLMNNK